MIEFKQDTFGDEVEKIARELKAAHDSQDTTGFVQAKQHLLDLYAIGLMTVPEAERNRLVDGPVFVRLDAGFPNHGINHVITRLKRWLATGVEKRVAELKTCAEKNASLEGSEGFDSTAVKEIQGVIKERLFNLSLRGLIEDDKELNEAAILELVNRFRGEVNFPPLDSKEAQFNDILASIRGNLRVGRRYVYVDGKLLFA